MPFRRRGRRARGRRTRRRTFRGRRMRRSRQLVLDPEYKLLNFNQINFDVSSAGIVFSLNSEIEQGVSSIQRIGIQHINLSSNIQMRFDLNGGIVPVTIKAWLVWDRDPRGVQMTVANLLSQPVQALESHRNLSHTLRLTVLWSRTFQMDVFNTQARMKKFIRMRKKSRWNSPDAGIGSLEHGALMLMFVSNIVAAPLPHVNWNHRLRFVG